MQESRLHHPEPVVRSPGLPRWGSSGAQLALMGAEGSEQDNQEDLAVTTYKLNVAAISMQSGPEETALDLLPGCLSG